MDTCKINQMKERNAYILHFLTPKSDVIWEDYNSTNEASNGKNGVP